MQGSKLATLTTPITFLTYDKYKADAFALVYKHFDEFLKAYPSVMDTITAHAKVEQDKQLLEARKELENAKMQFHQDLMKDFKKKQQDMQDALVKEYETKLEHQMEEKQKVIDEYMKANENKQGTHSLYRGTTFEKYIELLVANRFKNYIIDGNGATACMDVRMIDALDSSKVIGIECKSKNVISANDIKKFKKDKVSNSFWGSVFISECNSIPKKTTNQDEWIIVDNELWIQSSNENVILSAIGALMDVLNREDSIDQTGDRLLIVKQTDFITSMYDKLHSQKQSLLEQEKQMYIWIKEHNPDKLRNHLYLVSASKMTKKYKEQPY